MSGKIKDPDPPPNCFECVQIRARFPVGVPNPKTTVGFWILGFGLRILQKCTKNMPTWVGRYMVLALISTCFLFGSFTTLLPKASKQLGNSSWWQEEGDKGNDGLSRDECLKATPNMLTESQIVDLWKLWIFGPKTETPIRCQLCFGYRRFSWPHPRWAPIYWHFAWVSSNSLVLKPKMGSWLASLHAQAHWAEKTIRFWSWNEDCEPQIPC